jgi:hypothetical protein
LHGLLYLKTHRVECSTLSPGFANSFLVLNRTIRVEVLPSRPLKELRRYKCFRIADSELDRFVQINQKFQANTALGVLRDASVRSAYNQLVDGVAISPLGVSRGETVQHCGLGVFEVGQA